MNEKQKEVTLDSFVQLWRAVMAINAKVLGKRVKQTDNLTLLEAKLMDFLVSLISLNTQADETVEFKIADFWGACGMNPTTVLDNDQLVEEALGRLHSRSGYIPTRNPESNESVIKLIGIFRNISFTGADYTHCCVRFNPDLFPALSALNTRFLRATLGAKLSLESMGGWMLFELLCSCKNHQTPMFFKAWTLAKLLNAKREYRDGTFQTNVLDPAVDDINAHSIECKITYVPIAKNDRPSHYEFKWNYL